MITFDGIRITIGKRISGSQLSAVLCHYDISIDEFREALITGILSAYDEVDGKEVEIIHAPYSANWTKNPPGFRYEDLEFRDVINDYYYKGEKFKKFLSTIRPSPDAKIEAQKELGQQAEPVVHADQLPVTAPAPPEQTNPETFIRSLQISYLDNTEVKIQYKGKRMNYTCESIGFRDSKTKGWKTFLEILESTDHVYRLSPAYSINKETQQKVRIKNYDKRLQLLKAINEKFISFLTRQPYEVNFPPNFKLYERQPAQGKGAYSFKFQIPSDKPSYNTKDETLRRLKILIQNAASNEAINHTVKIAMEAGATKEEVCKIVQDRLPPQTGYHEITDDPETDDKYEEED